MIKQASLHSFVGVALAIATARQTLGQERTDAIQREASRVARTLFGHPRILILDEATSHVDVKGERSINAALNTMDMTRIIVAHRPETIDAADRVTVLEGGRVALDCTPESLREMAVAEVS